MTTPKRITKNNKHPRKFSSKSTHKSASKQSSSNQHPAREQKPKLEGRVN